MLKEYFKELPITTLILLFLFICGSLYLIGYWGTFDVDISNIVSATDIPKSFIMPFVVSNGMLIANILLQIIIFRHLKEQVVPKSEEVKKRTFFGRFWRFLLSVDAIFSLSAVFIISEYENNKLNGVYWLVSGFTVSILVGIKIVNLPAIRRIIPYEIIRMYTVMMLIYTPVMSFAIGKTRAINTYVNKQIRYATAIPTNTSINTQAIKDSSSLKLLGFLGDKIILSSLDNKKIYILNQSAFDIVELQDRAQKKEKNSN